MRLACAPINGLLNAVTLQAWYAVPELNGAFQLPGEERSIVLKLDPVEYQIVGTGVKFTAGYTANEKALIVGGTLSAATGN